MENNFSWIDAETKRNFKQTLRIQTKHHHEADPIWYFLVFLCASTILFKAFLWIGCIGLMILAVVCIKTLSNALSDQKIMKEEHAQYRNIKEGW